jgi:hypothetical protein
MIFTGAKKKSFLRDFFSGHPTYTLDFLLRYGFKEREALLILKALGYVVLLLDLSLRDTNRNDTYSRRGCICGVVVPGTIVAGIFARFSWQFLPCP